MTLTRRAAQSEGVRRPLEPRHANRPDDFLRSIRPRPLHVEDRVQPRIMLDVHGEACCSRTALTAAQGCSQKPAPIQ